MKALIIGATGATGKDLVNILLQDPDYSEVVTFVRRHSDINHYKLREILTDFNNLEKVSEYIIGDVLFSCLGTTLKVAGSKINQRHIDYEIPLLFADIAKRNGVPRVVLLSAYGASVSSKVFYSRLKGELEEKINELEFESYIIFKPGILLRKNSDRPVERLTILLLWFLNRIGIIRKFRPLPTAKLAEKLARAPKFFTEGKHVIELDKIFEPLI
jgi:uncharacterized protein YbjT (DUF2867 family)